MNIEYEFFSCVIDAETGETTATRIHGVAEIHKVEPQFAPDGAKVVTVEKIQPAPEVQGYYAEYVWQGDGR